MNWLCLPWIELAIAAPLIGFLLVLFFRTPATGDKIAGATTFFSLLASITAWFGVLSDAPLSTYTLFPSISGRPLFVVDSLSGPLLPVIALLNFLTVLSTARVKRNRMSYTWHLCGTSVRLATFACIEPWPLVALLTLGVLPPVIEIAARGKKSRVINFHMALFALFLIVGWSMVTLGLASLGGVLVLAAVLVRSGTVPAHLWVGDLFDRVGFGTALMFMTPITGVYAAIRLALPVAPEWALQVVTMASLFTAVYSAGLAMMQRDARRFFAYLFLSHASLVLVGLELHTTISLTGALAMWLAVAISLGGLGLIIRSVEARHGRLMLTRHLGLYEQKPSLAVGFLLMGLGSVGFPGTAAFVAAELLMDGAVEANIFVGVGMIIAATFNGIAVLRVYFLLFTGTRHVTAYPLVMTWRERVVILSLVLLILGAGITPQHLLMDRNQAADIIRHTLDTKHNVHDTHGSSQQ